MLWLLPDATTVAHPKLPPSPSSQAVCRRMQACLDATIDAESSKHDLLVQIAARCTVSDNLTSLVHEDGLWLKAVEVIGSMDLITHVALEIPLTFLSWTMLGEIFGGPHHELEFVCRVGHGSWVNDGLKGSVHGREED
jgi:hypothetical protein